MAGWTMSVRSSASGSLLVSTTSQPRTFEAPSMTLRPAGWFIQGSAMPGYWEPWPGKRIATRMDSNCHDWVGCATGECIRDWLAMEGGAGFIEAHVEG